MTQNNEEEDKEILHVIDELQKINQWYEKKKK